MNNSRRIGFSDSVHFTAMSATVFSRRLFNILSRDLLYPRLNLLQAQPTRFRPCCQSINAAIRAKSGSADRTTYRRPLTTSPGDGAEHGWDDRLSLKRALCPLRELSHSLKQRTLQRGASHPSSPLPRKFNQDDAEFLRRPLIRRKG
jgi:hypothetical protein